MLTAEVVADLAVPAEPVLSPDGRLVAYLVAGNSESKEGPRAALWLAAADGSTDPRRLTDVTAHAAAPKWAQDSASLYFTCETQESGGPQLQRLPLDGDAAPLPVQTLTRWRGGIAGHHPLTDGRTLALLAADEPTAEEERRAAAGEDARVWGRHLPPTRLRLLDLPTGRIRTVEGLGERHVVEVAQRPDGGPLAVLSWSTPEVDPGVLNARLHLLTPGTGAVEDLGPVGVEAQNPTWWRHEGQWHLAHLAVTPGHLIGALAVLDTVPPPDGAAPASAPVPASAPCNLTAGMAATPTELVGVADGPPLALFADGLDTAVHRLDPGTLRFQRLSRAPGSLAALSATSCGRTLAVLAGSAREPKNVHVGPVEGPWRRLSDVNPHLRAIPWGTQERLAYRARDGLSLDGLLILPVDRTRDQGPFPLITLAHGGPYYRSADDFALTVVDCGQWLASAGYAVFLPNPRGGCGHGQAFAAAAAGAVGGEEWSDILTGIDLLIGQGIADPARLGISGWSHGGFLAAWAACRTDRFRAAIMGAGISDWGMQAGTGEWGLLDAALGGSTGWNGPGPHLHDHHSPISYASHFRTPLLILHGEEDTNVPLSQALHLHRALRHHGAEHELVVYPREGHGLRERAHQLDALHRTRAWFDRWLTRE
ncbi:S9 family peptidase [Phaeacidiphilus oryzae]|uniref:S9 family peptidase n=1 Tax=Phaeacidiphilus oryzae TaxID=348818 RepID=UPI000567968C|nr:prolyl oligopeptidase family serine peptidase [Phaeacidiphilus oryzae]